MSAVHREWLDSQAQLGLQKKSRPAPHAWRHDTQSLAADEVRVVFGGEGGAVLDTVRRYPRTADEAFRTAAWRDPMSGPFNRPNPVLEALRWTVVVIIALAMVGVTL